MLELHDLSRRLATIALLATLTAGATACVPDDARGVVVGSARDAVSSVASGSTVADTSHRARPGYVVDSILPVEEELRRFRVGLTSAPVAFTSDASSRDALVRHLFAALSSADTSTLRALVLSRAEFAYLVYPSSPYTHAPYRQPPGVVWMQLQSENARGVHRLLERARGYRYLGHRCARPEHEGANTLWRQCRARIVRPSGDTVSMRLFGVIVERAGRFKFASYETDF